jgi:hypothetical protein
MLGKHEQALIEALRARPGIRKGVRTVGSLPLAPDDRTMLQRYLSDAPALYVTDGQMRVHDDLAVLTFTVAAVVRNVAGNTQARLGDGVAQGVDRLLMLCLRSLHGRTVGEASWVVQHAEYADSAAFDAAGLTVMAITLESTPIALPFALDDPEDAEDAADEADLSTAAEEARVGQLQHVHLDLDLEPQASAEAHGRWLQEPPDHSPDAPDLQADVSLPGSSAS